MIFETIVTIFMSVTAVILIGLIIGLVAVYIEQDKRFNKYRSEYVSRVNEKMTQDDISDIRCDIRAMERYLGIKKEDFPHKSYYVKKSSGEKGETG